MRKGNGDSIKISETEWCLLRVHNIIVEFAGKRLKLADQEKAALAEIREEYYRHLGLDPSRRYERDSAGLVHEVGPTTDFGF